MSFISVFEELNKLYESEQPEIEIDEQDPGSPDAEPTKDETVTESLTEAAEEAVEEAPVEEDEVPVEEEPAEETRRIVLECTNCGGIAILPDGEVVVDEESDLANVDKPCTYCEEANGFTIVGIVAPYESVEATEATEGDELEEGIFDRKPSAKQNEQLEEFENEVERIAKKSLYDIAGDFDTLMRSMIVDVKRDAEKKSKASNMAKPEMFETYLMPAADRFMTAVKKAMEAFKKLNSFNNAYYVMDKITAHFLGEAADNSANYKKLQGYDDLLLKLDEISVDKKVKQFALDQFAKDIRSMMEELYSAYKDLSAPEMFYNKNVQEELTEIFGLSKKEKEATYKRVVKDTINKDAMQFAAEFAGTCVSALTTIYDSLDDVNGTFKSYIAALDDALSQATKRPNAVVAAIQNVARKLIFDSTEYADIKAGIALIDKVQNSGGKEGAGAASYLYSKINEKCLNRLKAWRQTVKKKYGI